MRLFPSSDGGRALPIQSSPGDVVRESGSVLAERTGGGDGGGESPRRSWNSNKRPSSSRGPASSTVGALPWTANGFKRNTLIIFLIALVAWVARKGTWVSLGPSFVGPGVDGEDSKTKAAVTDPSSCSSFTTCVLLCVIKAACSTSRPSSMAYNRSLPVGGNRNMESR